VLLTKNGPLGILISKDWFIARIQATSPSDLFKV